MSRRGFRRRRRSTDANVGDVPMRSTHAEDDRRQQQPTRAHCARSHRSRSAMAGPCCRCRDAKLLERLVPVLGGLRTRWLHRAELVGAARHDTHSFPSREQQVREPFVHGDGKECVIMSRCTTSSARCSLRVAVAKYWTSRSTRASRPGQRQNTACHGGIANDGRCTMGRVGCCCGDHPHSVRSHRHNLRRRRRSTPTGDKSAPGTSPCS